MADTREQEIQRFDLSFDPRDSVADKTTWVVLADEHDAAISSLRAELATAQQENELEKTNYALLSEDYKALSKYADELRGQAATLTAERDELKHAVEQLCDDVREVNAGNVEDAKQIEVLSARVSTLEQALTIAAPHVCSLLCPSTKKTGEPWTHSGPCLVVTGVLSAPDQKGRTSEDR